MTHSDRTTLYRQFIDTFRAPESHGRVIPVTHAEIDATESTIASKLPNSYRTFVTKFGAGENEEPEELYLKVAEIWQPELIVRQVKQEWRAPIPAFLNEGSPVASDVAWKYLTPFASEESHGFWFCFPREQIRSDDAPVYFFNHDGGDIEQVADGFDDMIRKIIRGGLAVT